MSVEIPFVKKYMQARIIGLGEKNPRLYIDHDPEQERLEIPSYFYGLLHGSGKKILIHKYTNADIEIIHHTKVMDAETLEPINIGNQIFTMEVKSFDIREKEVMFIEKRTRSSGRFLIDKFMFTSVTSFEHGNIELIPDLFYSNPYGHVIFASPEKEDESDTLSKRYLQLTGYRDYYAEVRSRGTLQQTLIEGFVPTDKSENFNQYEGEYDIIELVPVTKQDAKVLINDGVHVYFDKAATKKNHDYKGFGGYFGSTKDTWKELQLKLGEI